MPAHEYDVIFTDLEERYGAINITYMNDNMVIKPTGVSPIWTVS